MESAISFRARISWAWSVVVWVERVGRGAGSVGSGGGEVGVGGWEDIGGWSRAKQ